MAPAIHDTARRMIAFIVNQFDFLVRSWEVQKHAASPPVCTALPRFSATPDSIRNPPPTPPAPPPPSLFPPTPHNTKVPFPPSSAAESTPPPHHSAPGAQYPVSAPPAF